MLRMAHRIISSGFRCKTHKQSDWLIPAIKSSPVLVIDNCAESLVDSFIETDRAFSPCDRVPIQSPFPNVFVEYNSPENFCYLQGWEKNLFSQFGCMVCSHPREEMLAIQTIATEEKQTTHIEFMQEMNDCNAMSMLTVNVFVMFNGVVDELPIRLMVFLNEHGVMIGENFLAQEIAEMTPGQHKLFSEVIVQACAPMWFALALCHAKNVSQTDITNTVGPPAKWLRRMKQPHITYRTLQIEAAKKTLRDVGKSDEVGFAKALHLVRGHFATYTADKPLFGHTVGTVWKPSHVRGDLKNGAIIKDYSIKAD